MGVGPTPFNMRDGKRQTPADHYLDPALSRDNLTLEVGVRVDRLILDGTRTTGLEATAATGVGAQGRQRRRLPSVPSAQHHRTSRIPLILAAGDSSKERIGRGAGETNFWFVLLRVPKIENFQKFT